MTSPLAGEPRKRQRNLPAARRVGSWLVWWVLMMSFWVMIDDSVETDELLAGAGAAALPLLRRGYEPGAGLTAPIQRFQSGVINDYVTWIVLGLAAIGGVLALIIR
jgi:hypothetical protein